MDKIKKILGEQPLAPPDLKEIEKQAAVPRNRLNEVIRLLEREGSVVRVTTDMYFLASSIEQLRATLVRFLAREGRDERRGVPRSDRLKPQVHDTVVGILRPRRADHSHRRHPQAEIADRRGKKLRRIENDFAFDLELLTYDARKEKSRALDARGQGRGLSRQARPRRPRASFARPTEV